MNVKLVSQNRKVSRLCEVEPGTFPEYGTWETWDDMPSGVEDNYEEWETREDGPIRWVAFVPRGVVGATTIATSGDIWLQDDHGGTLERVR